MISLAVKFHETTANLSRLFMKSPRRFLRENLQYFYRHSGLARFVNGMLAEKQNAVFIHIPKNAGTSIYVALRQFHCVTMKTVEDVELGFPQKGFACFGHMDYAALVKSNLVPASFDNTAFKFCFSRNPFDRALSLYHYSRKIRRIEEDVSFLSFCRRLWEQGPERIGLYNSVGLSQCNPQVRWIENLNIDFIGRFETLSKDFDALCNRLQLKSAPLAHINASARGMGRDVYCSESIEIVRDFYKEDFDYFHYSREYPESL